jgi:uroporphyrinogen decarboxylase
MMTSRERIRAAIAFEPPDRLPIHESPWEQTLSAWHRQGLPREADPADHFGWDLSFMYLDVSPRFEQRVIDRSDGSITYEDRFGYTVTKPEGISSTMSFLDHRTRCRDDWDMVRRRFTLSADPSEPARIDDRSYFGHFGPYPSWDDAVAKFRRARSTGRYILFMCYGPWEATWRHRGMTEALMDIMTDPEWVEDMGAAFQGLVVDVLSRCIELGMKPDGLFVADDLGCTQSLLMPPDSWRRVFKHQVERLGVFLDEQGVDFWMHSDGAIHPLVDDLLDCGVRVLNPIEVRAGMDAPKLRDRYGSRLALFGNIDAERMSGSIAGIDAELRRKIPLAGEGGYIMHSDHSCPPQVSFERYRWIIDRARAIFCENGRDEPVAAQRERTTT